MKTNISKCVFLLTVLALMASLLVACGVCKHNYQERSGRIVCVECKEECIHTYQIDENNAYCTNCLFSCDHSFSDQGGNMVCNACGIVCSHEYKNIDGAYKCQTCGIPCEHEFESQGSMTICAKCGAEKVVLTADNVNDFFVASVRTDKVFVGGAGLGTLDYEKGEGEAEITIANKTGYSFNNVVLTVTIDTNSKGWTGYTTEIPLSYDGEGQKTIIIRSNIQSYVNDNPSFTATITGVTGEIAE